MLQHKCSYKELLKEINALEPSDRMRKKIKETLFRHFLEFDGKIVVNGSILDETCGRWVGEGNRELNYD